MNFVFNMGHLNFVWTIYSWLSLAGWVTNFLKLNDIPGHLDASQEVAALPHIEMKKIPNGDQNEHCRVPLVQCKICEEVVFKSDNSNHKS